MQEKRDGRIILDEEDFREKLFEGARATYTSVATTYGPKGKNVLIEKPFGRPVLTRDGVTVAKEVYFSDRAKNMGSGLVKEACEATNAIAGDGTSGTAVLAYKLLTQGARAIAAGMHPMEIKDMLTRDSETLLKDLEGMSKPIADGQDVQVATVSCGDRNLGRMIAAAIEKVGVDGGVIVERAPQDTIECEFIDGYYLQVGFNALERGKKELIDPYVIVTQRGVTSSADANELLTKSLQAAGVTRESIQQGNVPRLVFVGNIDGAAYNFIVNLVNTGMIDAVIIKTPPMYGDMGRFLLEDIAVYAGSQVITESTNLKEPLVNYIGKVDRVVATKTEATLFADNSTEAVKERVQVIKDQVQAETHPSILERLNDRVSKLEGKIALFRIGAMTETAKEELEYRVEDALNATRAAVREGVVPGGGTTLVALSKSSVSDYYQQALRDTFGKLMSNANLNPEMMYEKVTLTKTPNAGVNLRVGNTVVDMIESGVLDPSLVIQQIIKNATEAACNILTVGAGLIFQEKQED